MEKHFFIEAIDWMLFSAGAIIAAFLLPILIVMTGLAIPFGFVNAIDYAPMISRLANPMFKIYAFFVLTGTVWFSMHRIRFILYDLGLVKFRGIITVLSFASLAVLIAAILYVILQ